MKSISTLFDSTDTTILIHVHYLQFDSLAAFLQRRFFDNKATA